MSDQKRISGVLIDESTTFSYIEVCQRYHIPEKLLMEMLEEGLFSNQASAIEDLQINAKELYKIESAFRLHQDLDINLPGVVLALELLDKIEQLNNELSVLRKHI
jgi:chaperone modulatory protein CbpM